MKRIKVITIDGPAASGKGSLAISIANKFSFKLLDSGSLYRLFALFERRNIDHMEIVETIKNRVEFELTKDSQSIILDKNVDITNELKSEDVAKSASILSSQKEVRNHLFKLQRDFYQGSELVADGRDMGTVIFPEANIKIYLTASLEERASRRYRQLKTVDSKVNMRILLDKLAERDKIDKERDHSPLKPAEDSLVIDTTNLNPWKVLEEIKRIASGEI